MLRMAQVHVIRHKVLVEGLSIRQVAQELDVSRNTVSKYLKQPQPVRHEGPRRKPVLERVASRIDQLVEEWSDRTTPKQRITGTRIHRQLREEGYEVGTTTVRTYLREKRRQAAEVYIPLVYRPGNVAQVDFFEVTVDEQGVRRKAWKFLMRLMYSGRDFVWLYDRCDQLSFLDGHVRGFAHFGGVPQRLAYDNLTAAVKRRVKAHRELTERFRALSSHYLFEPCFARPGEGHDKGGVEARGKGIRLAHMTPIPQGDTLAHLAAALLADVDEAATTKVGRDGCTAMSKFEQDAAHLRPLPPSPFDVRRVVLITVSRQALVRFDGVEYSVPSEWARLDATAYVGVDTIDIHCLGSEVTLTRTRHSKRQVKYCHYLSELSRKPQALRQVAPELLNELEEPYRRLWDALADAHGELEAARVLAKILAVVGISGQEKVAGWLDQALRRRAFGAEPTPAARCVEVPAALACYTVAAGRAADYDVLLGGTTQ
jgi:transposase